MALLGPDRKKMASIIVGKLRDQGASPDEKEIPHKEGAEQDDTMALDSACEKMLTAFESKDVPLLRSAIEDFLDIRESRSAPMEPEGPQGEGF